MPIFEEVFKYGAPKTISPHSPPYNNPALLEAYPDTVQHTIQLFMNDVKNLIHLPDLRTLLKLYTSISLDKLATLTNKDKDELIVQLMLLKGNMKIVKWTESSASSATAAAAAEDGDATVAGGSSSGGLLNGEEVVVGNLGFSIDNDTINITETRRTRQFAGRFLSQGLAAKQILDQRKSACAICIARWHACVGVRDRRGEEKGVTDPRCSFCMDENSHWISSHPLLSFPPPHPFLLPFSPITSTLIHSQITSPACAGDEWPVRDHDNLLLVIPPPPPKPERRTYLKVLLR